MTEPESVIKNEFSFVAHEDRLYCKQTQPTEKIILERNQQLRNNPGVIRDLSDKETGETWGRQVASIPRIMFDKVQNEGKYDLYSKEGMAAFLQTAEGKLCLVQGK